MKSTNIYGLSDDLSVQNPFEQHEIDSFDTGTRVLTWVKKDGIQSIVIAANKLIDFLPLDGITYPVGVVESGVSVVYRGRGVSVDLSSLDESKDWFLYVFAFNGVQSTEKYNRTLEYTFVPGTVVIEEFNIITEDVIDIVTEDDLDIIQENG